MWSPGTACVVLGWIGSHVAASRTSHATPAGHGAHLNAVLDFGAVPDGVCANMSTSCTGTDNSRALQAAINAAQRDGRALYLPSGRYMVSRTLTVGCATPATTCPGCKPTGDAGGCVEPNATEGVWGLHPLIMTGAGRSLTTIATVENIHAILEFNGPADGGTLGKSSILHDLRDLAFDAGGGNSCPNSRACGQANFSIYASSITRSDFTRLNFYNARVAAVSLAYGWINRIRDSLFAGNNIGLHVWNQCNNIDITGNNFYGNHLPLVVEDGAQIQISGNVIEGSQCPAIVAASVYGLLISSNYFESNNMCVDCALKCNVYQVGPKGSNGSFNVSISADIVLNGVIDNAGDPTWSFGIGNAVRDRAISSEFPCRAVTIEGGYHSPKAETKNGNGTLVLIGAVQGALIRGNDCGGGGQCKNMAVVTTGTDATLWGARDISLERNTGWDFTGGAVRLVSSPKCLRRWDPATRIGVQTQQGSLPWSCEGRLDTVSDTPALCSGTNIGYGVGDNERRQRPYACTSAPPTNFVTASSSAHSAPIPGFSAPTIDPAESYDGHLVHRISAPAGAEPAAALIVAELPLASMPSAAGHSVHFTVFARTVKSAFHPRVKDGWNTTMATLILLIDRGDGVWLSSNGGELADWGGSASAGLGAPAWMNHQWDVHSFATWLGWGGTAKMAIACAAGGEVEVAWVKVAPVGAPSEAVPLSAHSASALQSHATAATSADTAAGEPVEVYAITTFSETDGFNVYTLPTDLSATAQLAEVGRLGYPSPGGVPTFTAGPLQGGALTEYVQWAPGDLRDHTLFGHNGQLFAVCTTSWGHPGDGTGGSGSGYGNFHILKRKRRGSWVLHSRVVVPHTLADNRSAPTSTLWSPIPWRFGDTVAIFVSATRGPPNFATVMVSGIRSSGSFHL